MVVYITFIIKDDPIKTEGAFQCSQHFLYYNPTEAICCHGNNSSDFDLTQNLMQPIPFPRTMLQINLIAIILLFAEVFMFESVDGRTDGRWLNSHSISSPCEASAQMS